MKPREPDLENAKQYIELLFLTPDVSIESLCFFNICVILKSDETNSDAAHSEATKPSFKIRTLSIRHFGLIY